MSGSLVDKVYIGLDNAPAAFDIKGRILGPNGTNLEYIRSETGVTAVLKGDKFEPLHLSLHHNRPDAISAAKSLALNLIETIKAELVQWMHAQTGGQPPAMNVPPPTITTTTPPVPSVQAPPVSTVSTPTPITSAQPTVLPPVVSVAQASTPLMTVRQPTVLQLLPQQQYVLNQENGQLIPIVQPGMQMQNQITQLPIAQQLGAIQQQNFGTQLVDLSGMQPVNVTQLRLSGVPSSMSMLLPNGLTLPQANMNSNDSTTVSSATSTPVVCAAQGTNASQKILYSTDKAGDKTDVKYQIQGTDTVQWTLPGSQTMLIPYQQLQDLAANQTGLANLQSQQFVSIAPAGGLPQTSLPLTAAQFQQLQATGIMQLNQKPMACNGSFINIISTGQASSPQIISASTPTKNLNNPDQRGQKRMSDGTPNQLQLRPIAPAGSHVSQDKSSTRDSRSWTSGTAKDNNMASMGMKINPAHGTIIHVSSGQQTSVSSGVSIDGTGMYIKHIDRNAIQIQAKDNQKHETTNKIQNAPNVQMITVPPGMTVLQNPLNIGQMPVLGQHNSQVYMIPANQSNLVPGLSTSLMGQQILQPGQNVTVMQPNQLGVPNSVQYNIPMNVQPNTQYVSGINLNNLSAQQLGLGQQLTNQNIVSGSFPIVQAPNSQMTNQQITVSQSQPVQQILSQNSFITPTSQYNVPQYMMQPNLTVPNQIQYNIQTPANTTAQTPVTENETPVTNTTNQTYIQENGYTQNSQSNFPETTQYQSQNNQNSTQNYVANTATQSAYTPATQNNFQPSSQSQTYTPALPPQTVAPTNYSPTTTPAPNQNYQNIQTLQNATYTQNPYPNATGQNIPYNQYQYGNMQNNSRPWFRPRFSSPQSSPYNGSGPPPPNTPMPVPPPTGNYNYWQDS